MHDLQSPQNGCRVVRDDAADSRGRYSQRIGAVRKPSGVDAALDADEPSLATRPGERVLRDAEPEQARSGAIAAEIEQRNERIHSTRVPPRGPSPL